MRFIPAKQTLDMQFEGEPTTDRFNNIIPGVSEWRPVKVAQWWVDKTEEREGDSILRTVDMLHVHLPTENVPPSWGRIRTPNGSIWEVEGNVEDFTNGWHGWNPGLVVVHAKKVSG